MRKLVRDEQQAYETMKTTKEKFGVFYKTCFHLHTPESYDYKLLEGWSRNKYQLASEDEIFKRCIKEKVFPETFSLADFLNEDKYKIYRTKKEALSFFLLDERLMINEIAVVIVADHHTIEGVNKLKFAINELYTFKKRSVYPEVFLGVEISCADKNHVVGIFEDTKSTRDSIKKWLEENLLTIEEGSFKTSIDVLEFIEKQEGIGYLAHLDTSSTFGENYLSGAYKTVLFKNKTLLIGLSDFTKKEYIKDKIKLYSSSTIKFILDNDAHDISTVGNKIVWIKGSKRNYSMIKEAVEDYDISISFEKEIYKEQYIKGIYIENSPDGFLSGEEEQAFCLTFSTALNCLIGGRGTGKSSILEILEYILSQYCENINRLDFICAHGNSWVLYEYKGNEYLIEMRMPFKKDSEENILKYFGMNSLDDYHYHYYYDTERIRDFARLNYLKISKVIYDENEYWLEEVQDKQKILKNFFDVRYSINNLVNIAGSKRINEFIYETLFENKNLSTPDKAIHCKKKSGLKKVLENIRSLMERRREEVNSVIVPFNIDQKNVLRIVYSQTEPCSEPDLAYWLFGDNYNPKRFYKNHNITQGNIIEYLLTICERKGLFEFLFAILNEDISFIPKGIELINFSTEMTPTMIEKGILSLSVDKSKEFTKEIFHNLITADNIDGVIKYLKKYVKSTEKFSLEFNVNNKEGGTNTPIYRSIGDLSLGQKVAAMLDFIIGYGNYSRDYRPLIIDQPEDNLDNQYIYKNLVHQLRKVKEKRQIIIATHSATIVTNAKADQVCIMVSDNQNGWIETTGYPGEKRIKRHIINYLEGGEESFLHKLNIYRDALKL